MFRLVADTCSLQSLTVKYGTTMVDMCNVPHCCFCWLYDFSSNDLLSKWLWLWLSLTCRYDTVFINLKSKPDWLFELNPFGLVPILEHKGSVIYESAVCNEFLEEAFPGSSTGTRDLLPSCPYRRAAVRLLMLKIDKVCMSLTFSHQK